jgi:hypothetical protein
MISLVVLALVLAVGVVPVTRKWHFGQSEQGDAESREKSLAIAVEVEEFLTSWRVRHKLGHRLRRHYLRHRDWRS